jgi:hypothetical protein
MKQISTHFKLIENIADAPPNSLMDSTVSPKMKTREGERIEAHSLARSTLRVEGHAEVLGWD